jgi:hypothetical protein
MIRVRPFASLLAFQWHLRSEDAVYFPSITAAIARFESELCHRQYNWKIERKEDSAYLVVREWDATIKVLYRGRKLRGGAALLRRIVQACIVRGFVLIGPCAFS